MKDESKGYKRGNGITLSDTRRLSWENRTSTSFMKTAKPPAPPVGNSLAKERLPLELMVEMMIVCAGLLVMK
jgi:hypothetical protein